MTNSMIIALKDEELGLVAGGARTQDQIIWDEYVMSGGTTQAPGRKGPQFGTVQTINFPERAPPPKPAPKKGGKK